MADIPPLRLPPEFVKVTVALAELDDSAETALRELLDDATDVVDRRAAGAAIDDWGGLPDVPGEELLDLLISLAGIGQESQQANLHQVAAALAASPDLPKEVLQESLTQRLVMLLDTKIVDLLGRGLDLLAEHEHLLVSARILSDIRPLFDQEDPADVDGSVIGHVLRLSFARGEPRTLDVALDLDDLRRLEIAIQRAVQKEEKLRAMVRSTNNPLVIPFAGRADV